MHVKRARAAFRVHVCTADDAGMALHLTHIGTATLVIEIDGVRLLTDPAFDPPGATYGFGWGTRSRRLAGPALAAAALGPIDAVLLSHDQHADNLDGAGRALLPSVATVITTRAAARRLGHPGAIGLAPFAATRLGPLRITATPARHGPACSRPVVGPVIGFVIEGPGLAGPLYLSGDTVWFRGVAEVARRWRVDTAVLHLGGVGFRSTGPIRYTFDAAGAITAARALAARAIVPVHYDGWTHFREAAADARRALAATELADRVAWLTPGARTAL